MLYISRFARHFRSFPMDLVVLVSVSVFAGPDAMRQSVPVQVEVAEQGDPAGAHSQHRRGRPKVSERTADLVHAAGCGTVLTLLAVPADRRDMGPSDAACDAVIAAITTGAPPLAAPGPRAAASALRAGLPEVTVLTDDVRHVLKERLDRTPPPKKQAVP